MVTVTLRPGDESVALPPVSYALHAPAERALAAAAAQPPAGWQPTGYTSKDYLSLVASICGYFWKYQDQRGAILDPNTQEEQQYATPCYAVAAGLVALGGRPPVGVWGAARRDSVDPPEDEALLQSAARALDHSLRALAVDKDTPQGHADFFAPLVVLGYQLLAPFVAPERAARWQTQLRSIDPETTYRDTFQRKEEAGQPPTVHNWNVVAVTGEILRAAAGTGLAFPWVERYLDYQLEHYADLTWGLYREPNCPLPYDLFPRHHLAYALAGGYRRGNPERRARLLDWLQRGEWTSALTQTASGGIPPGWRSSEHVWNDAALVALGEVAAARYARGRRPVAAGLFRRVATLAFRSMLQWQRPSGELCIVKNHIDPAERHGYETYSFHSSYGLYPAAMLVTAILFGDCTTAEAPAPVETGAYVLRYPDAFHHAIATRGGVTLAFDLDADGHYDVTGLNSVRRIGAHPLLGPASGIPAHPRYAVPDAPGRAYAPGLSWGGTSRDGGAGPHSLAGTRPNQVNLHVEREDAEEAVFSLRYLIQADGCEAIHSRYRFTRSGIEGEDSFEGSPSAHQTLGFTWPFPTDSGRDRSQVQLDGSHLAVSLGEWTQHLVLASGSFSVARERVAYRNGFASVASTRAEDGRIRWRLDYLKHGAGTG